MCTISNLIIQKLPVYFMKEAEIIGFQSYLLQVAEGSKGKDLTHLIIYQNIMQQNEIWLML